MINSKNLLLGIIFLALIVSGCVSPDQVEPKFQQEPTADQISEKKNAIPQNQPESEKIKTVPENSEHSRTSAAVSVEVPGSAELVDASGDIVAALSRDRVIEVIDVSDPKRPRVAKTITTPAFAEVVYNDGNYIYVVDSRELQIYKDPLNEPLYKYHLSAFWPSAITVNSNLVYLVSGDQMMILDVSNPSAIQQVSITKLTGQGPNNIIVKDGYAYVIETLGGLNIVNVQDPKNPKVVKVIPFESHTVGFKVRGNYAYVARITKITSQGSSYSSNSVFETLDISNPATTSVVASVEIGSSVIDLDLQENYAIVAGDYPYRTTVIDISTPTKPVKLPNQDVIVGSVDFQGVAISNGYAYFSDGNIGLRIVDVSDVHNLKHVTDLDLQGRGYKITKVGNYVYVTVEKKYLNLIDASNPQQPTLAASEVYVASYEASSFAIDNKRAYINAQGLKIFDVTNPAKPVQIQKTTVNADSIQVQGNYVYSTIGEIGLLVYDISNPSTPKLIGTAKLPGQARDLSVNGKWAVVVTNIPYSVLAIDITNPQNPIAKKPYGYQRYPKTVTVKDGFIYVARQEDGTDILKIQPDGSVEFIKNIPTQGFVHHATASGKKLFVIRDGTDVYDIADPKNPVFLQHLSNNGEAIRGDVEGEYLYIADGPAGVTVLKVN